MNFKIGYFLLSLSFLFIACDKDEPIIVDPVFYENSGELVGFDLALCACCGGHIFDLDGSDAEFRIMEFPADFQSTLDTIELPQRINLNYTEINACGPYGHIRVDQIEVQ